MEKTTIPKENHRLNSNHWQPSHLPRMMGFAPGHWWEQASSQLQHRLDLSAIRAAPVRMLVTVCIYMHMFTYVCLLNCAYMYIAFWPCPTVPTFNSCTKCGASPGIIHDRTPDATYSILLGTDASDDLTTERSFDSQATWVIDGPGISFWHVIHRFLYNQALADVRSTGAGIKCLYCIGPIGMLALRRN